MKLIIILIATLLSAAGYCQEKTLFDFIKSDDDIYSDFIDKTELDREKLQELDNKVMGLSDGVIDWQMKPVYKYNFNSVIEYGECGFED